MDGRYVYDLSEGSAEMKALLGGKGAGVAEMMRIGVPVPDGFTVTTSACVDTMRNGGTWPERLWDEIRTHLDALERRTGRRLGAAERPLLVSVRSGAVLSMPGMMDTILNLGISDEAAEGLAAESDDPRSARPRATTCRPTRTSSSAGRWTRCSDRGTARERRCTAG
jgi:pyruvate,orthophosphate dikinase